MFGIRRSLADKYFSDWIRQRDDWTCQRCFTQYERPSQGLHCSHFHSRRNRSVRFDPENAVSLCMRCHLHMGENPQEHVDFFLKRLGKEKYDALFVRARTPAKVDEKEIVLAFKLELEKMKGERKVLQDYK